jgi:hypothetical protein
VWAQQSKNHPPSPTFINGDWLRELKIIFEDQEGLIVQVWLRIGEYRLGRAKHGTSIVIEVFWDSTQNLPTSKVYVIDFWWKMGTHNTRIVGDWRTRLKTYLEDKITRV